MHLDRLAKLMLFEDKSYDVLEFIKKEYYVLSILFYFFVLSGKEKKKKRLMS